MPNRLDQTTVSLISVAVAAIVAILGWLTNQYFSARHAARARKADFIRTQISQLYGPVVFIAELNESLWKRCGKIDLAYHEYFKDRTGRDFSQEMTNVIAKKNLYGARVVQNNRELIPLLKANWGLLDTDDVELVAQFLSDVSIQDVESDRESPNMPGEFYMDGILKNCLGPTIISRPGFAQSMRQKLISKQSELSRLTGTISKSKDTTASPP